MLTARKAGSTSRCCQAAAPPSLPPGSAATVLEINLLNDPDKNAGVIAIVEPGVMGAIKSCDGQWCEMTFDGHTGWLPQSLVWGAYPGERVKN